MMVTVAEVIKEAREVFLNDTNSEIFSDAVLFPFVSRAYDELQNKLARSGNQVTEEISTLITIPPNTTEFTAIPADLIEPVSIEERASGSSDSWIEVRKERSLISGNPSDTLGGWDWAENSLKFRGATGARQIKLRYIKYQTVIVSNTSELTVINCKPFLAARIAALAAGHIGGNETRAAYIQIDATAALDDLLGIAINEEQSTPTRRQPFRR